MGTWRCIKRENKAQTLEQKLASVSSIVDRYQRGIIDDIWNDWMPEGVTLVYVEGWGDKVEVDIGGDRYILEG